MVEDEEYNSVFSALSHPLRRNILTFIVERGPQGYSELLSQFSLETGTLNYHLERMTAFLEQDEDGKYKSKNVGYAAYRLLRSAKSELSNPHAPPIVGISLLQNLRRFGEGLFDTLLLPEQAFKDAQSLTWPYLLIAVVIVGAYLSFHEYRNSIVGLTSGGFIFIFLTGFFILASFGIYRRRFSLLSALACYGVGFLPLTVWNFLSYLLSADPTYSTLQYLLFFWLFVWDAYLFLVAGKECFKLTMSQSFTSAALGFIGFLVVVRLVVSFLAFPLIIP